MTYGFHAIIEVLGKPEQHVQNMINNMMKKLQEDERFQVNKKEVATTQKQEKVELWSTFAEVDIECQNVQNITEFCFDYMPSSIQIYKPQTIELPQKEFTDYLNDLQAKLHQVDMVAKQMKMKHEVNAINMARLLSNYILILLSKNKLTLQQLSGFTGVSEDKMGDYLDKLIDDKKVDLEGEHYVRVMKKEEAKTQS